MHLHIDFETRSAVDLREVGLYNYARHPTTDVWCLSAAFGDEDPFVNECLPFKDGRLIPCGSDCTDRAFKHVKSGGTVVAHNAPFELAIWNNIMVPRYGWPVLQPEQTYCTMAMAYAMGLPGALEDAALALGLHVLKDKEGRSLMLRMSKPRKMNPDGTYTWWDQPDKLARLYAYCQQDVRVERELHKRLVPLSEKERKIWLLDYKINNRGMRIDRASVDAAVKMADTMKADYDRQMSVLTDGAVQTCNALIPLKQWLADHGLPEAQDGLDKQAVADFQSRDLPLEVQTALTLRQDAAKASTAKLAVMTKIAGEDDRMRGILQYHGAATGRWAGRKVQPHNFPREVPKPEVVEKILELVRAGDHDAIDMIYGSPVAAISRCLRGFIVPAPGNVLEGGDYSAIEGRGTAWIAGEERKLQLFRECDANPDGPDVYMHTAGGILGIDPMAVNKDQRQAYGKVPELALGYQGGVGAFQAMAKTYGVTVSDDEADSIKVRWRARHPKIKQAWYDLQDAAIKAVQKPGDVWQAGHPERPVKFKKVGSFLWCLLPSGRALCYPYPKLLPGMYGERLTYMTVPSQEDKKKGKIIADPNNGSNWARVGTYSGSLMENVVQAICRDLLAEALLRLDACGFDIVLHVHDEIVAEDETDRSEEMTRIIGEVPAWAKDFPVAVKCNAMQRYGK